MMTINEKNIDSAMNELYDHMYEQPGDFEFLYWYRMHLTARMEYPRPDDAIATKLNSQEKHAIENELISMSKITDPEMCDKEILSLHDYLDWENDIISKIKEGMKGIKFYKIVYALKNTGGFTTFACEYDLPKICSVINETEGAALCHIEQTAKEEDIEAYIKLVTYIDDALCYDNGEDLDYEYLDEDNEDDEEDEKETEYTDPMEKDMNELKNESNNNVFCTIFSIRRLNHSYNEVGYIIQAHFVDNLRHAEYYASIDTTSNIRGHMFRITDKNYIELVLGNPDEIVYLQPFTILYEKACENMDKNDDYYMIYKFMKKQYNRCFDIDPEDYTKHKKPSFLSYPDRYFTDDGIEL